MNVLYTLVALLCIVALAFYMARQGICFPKTTNVTRTRNKRPYRAKKPSDHISSSCVQYIIVNALKLFEDTYLSGNLSEKRERRLATFAILMDRQMMRTAEAFGFGGDAKEVLSPHDPRVHDFCIRLYDSFLAAAFDLNPFVSNPEKIQVVLKHIDDPGLFHIYSTGMLSHFARFELMDDLTFEIETNTIEDKEIDRYITYLKENPIDRSDERQWIFHPHHW